MRNLTPERIISRYKAGYGQGDGLSYRPWLGVNDVPSHGVTTHLMGRKTHRMHVVFSNLERHALLVAQWLDDVVDLREQYPLWPLDETIAIAEDLGVRHPTHPKGDLVLMTTDILLTRSRTAGTLLEPITVKPESELRNDRVLEKLEIERVYWERRGSTLGIVTEAELPAGLVGNLEWIDEYHEITTETLCAAAIANAEDYLFAYLRDNPTVALNELCARADNRLGHRHGTCLIVVRHALSRKRWTVPLASKIEPHLPMPSAALRPRVAKRLVPEAA
jgi:hypothetical protein